MKQIILTQGKVALVDDLDYEYLINWKWHACKGGRTFYAARSIIVNNTYVKVTMHRQILQHIDNKNVIDHIDHDGLNNQRVNLREATHSQNGANRRSHINSSSKYLGVFYCKKRRRWKAEVKKENKTYFLGWFKNEDLAALAYNNKAHELFNDYSNKNIIK